jgi:hypothetical protein
MKPQEYPLYRMITCIWQLNNPLETVNFLYPTYAGCTARTCKPYIPHMQAVRHTDVGYKLIAIKVGLLSHTSWIYIDSLQQKQAILRLFEPYLAILLMRDTRFLVVWKRGDAYDTTLYLLI